ncbi:hypothetical protein RZS08_10755, partial [Arthrospira platensis SPKY1]|nr:hypothetical protein [Arthrospira platensis SPKY1]
FEPLTPESPDGYAPVAEYVSAYDAMAQGQATCVALFEALSQQYPEDPLVRLHHERLQALDPNSVAERTDHIVMDAK